VIRFLKIY